MQQKIISLKKQLKLLYNLIDIKNKGVDLNMGNSLNIKKGIEKNQINIFDVANYIIDKCDDISNLKLQKLMFYIYAHYLVKNNPQTLFTNSAEKQIEAWPYGPVFPYLYFEFRTYGMDELKETPLGDKNKITSSSYQTIIDYILEKYGKFKAWELAEKTHSEDPWTDAYNSDIEDYSRQLITDNAIYQYYNYYNL
ncbi:Panacea domain-containing protein [Candidatus Phytoplasma sp. AldY-WA1]|jgi:uncharacterized phage-associated protein|uniref:Panacea domain-containing protein n=1 Tax=Candidatus Phytoplasma sp. AldY-WA1 TaxID=2852100 RepID=UPI00254A196A|nr:type II toxin-antitoxin system antitoxin SocA domain-containing protein [Candidatus Phytoplasma sp. AldY-WA1]